MKKRRKKKSLLTTLPVLCMMLIMICTITVPGIYAKYASQVSGSDTATVAKWSFKVNGTEIATTNPTVSFDLFNTIKDSTGATTEVNESDVAANMLAPGTSGEFALKFENLSDVTAVYEITTEVENSLNVPLKFKIGNATEWSDSLQGAIDTLNEETRTLTVGAEVQTITVKWMWDFEGDHTSVGIAAREADSTTPATVKVTTKITVKQKN